jgi:Domain of unknown function (DUF4383)
MSTARRIALWSAVAFLLVGILGLIFVRKGNLLGIFPVNVWLEIAYIATGVWLFAASTEDALTRTASTILGPVYGVLGVIGLIWPSWGVFGLIPLYGLNVALFIAFAVLMVYDWLSIPSSSHHTTA